MRGYLVSQPRVLIVGAIPPGLGGLLRWGLSWHRNPTPGQPDAPMVPPARGAQCSGPPVGIVSARLLRFWVRAHAVSPDAVPPDAETADADPSGASADSAAGAGARAPMMVWATVCGSLNSSKL